jgi:phosphoglycolate phosphatase
MFCREKQLKAMLVSDINLLIFDLDGTLSSSGPPIFEAVRRAFDKLGLPLTLSESDIQCYLGLSGDEFHQAIAASQDTLPWEELRQKVRSEYPEALASHASVFPCVLETLALLRRRGYVLAICSASGTSWFRICVKACGLEPYFGYIECAGDHGLTKTEMILKIKDTYPGLQAAVIGDRSVDIQAARETSSLSIGVRFGYGGSEPESADLKIDRFADLLNMFDRRFRVFETIYHAAEMRSDRPLVIGITGIDASGKTTFTQSLAGFLESSGERVQIINLDDFHNPRHIRFCGVDQVDSYHSNAFDLKQLVSKLLVPLRERGELSTDLTLLDLQTDQYSVRKHFEIDRNTVVLLEGVFLFREELSPFIDLEVFLEIPFVESLRRATARDVPIFGSQILARYEERYFPAQRRYLAEYPPDRVSDIILDNTDWEKPRILKGPTP